MRVEGCRLKNVTFVLGEMREGEDWGKGLEERWWTGGWRGLGTTV